MTDKITQAYADIQHAQADVRLAQARLHDAQVRHARLLTAAADAEAVERRDDVGRLPAGYVPEVYSIDKDPVYRRFLEERAGGRSVNGAHSSTER